MVTHHFLQEKSAQTSLTLGVGKFDGVHLGHQKIIQVIRERASLTGSQPGVFTFRHFPVSFLLSSWNEKQSLLKKFGIKWCLWSDFEELSHWEPERF
ncbi:MAG TPA: hypothetical protein PKX93_03730, partial [bacterium]|nr:hypothetical protein [bacterium]